MPQPLNRSGSEPREAGGRMPTQPHQMGGRDPREMMMEERPRHSALGLEGMDGVPDQVGRGLPSHGDHMMKPPTVGRQLWYES
jgi:hypothetical protein